VTVQQVRRAFSELLRERLPGPGEIARAANRVLRRNVESRIYHWCSATGRYPPCRSP
jgi:hypothetical protein